MSGDDTESPPNPRIGWRHEWGTLVLLWAMVIWVSVTILGTKGGAASLVTPADVVVVAFVLLGAVLATLTIVRAAEIPMLSVAPPATAAAEVADQTEPEPEPEAKAEKPEAEAEKPEAEAEKPEAKAEKPEAKAKAKKPEAESEAEEAEAKAEKPEAKAEKAEAKAKAKKPEAESEAEEAEAKAEVKTEPGPDDASDDATA